MSELMPLGRPSPGLQRKVTRDLMKITVDTGLSTARIRSGAEIEGARVSAIANIGARAQEELAMLVNQERMLIEAVPEAESGLLYLRGVTQLSMACVLRDASRRMGR